MKLKIDLEKEIEIANLQHKFLKENPELTPLEALEMAKAEISEKNN
jgi:hypothetical protein